MPSSRTPREILLDDIRRAMMRYLDATPPNDLDPPLYRLIAESLTVMYPQRRARIALRSRRGPRSGASSERAPSEGHPTRGRHHPG